jgi:hypothetical protein
MSRKRREREVIEISDDDEPPVLRPRRATVINDEPAARPARRRVLRREPRLIQKQDLGCNRCIYYALQNIIQDPNFSYDQWLDYCELGWTRIYIGRKKTPETAAQLARTTILPERIGGKKDEGWATDRFVQPFLEDRFGPHSIVTIDKPTAEQVANLNCAFVRIKYTDGRHPGGHALAIVDGYVIDSLMPAVYENTGAIQSLYPSEVSYVLHFSCDYLRHVQQH